MTRRKPDPRQFAFDFSLPVPSKPFSVTEAHGRPFNDEERSAVALYLSAVGAGYAGWGARVQFMRFVAVGAVPYKITVRARGWKATIRWTRTRLGYSAACEADSPPGKTGGFGTAGGFLEPNYDDEGPFYWQGNLTAQVAAARELCSRIAAQDPDAAAEVERALRFPHCIRIAEPIEFPFLKRRLVASGPDTVPVGGTHADLLAYEEALGLSDVTYGIWGGLAA